MSEFLYSLKKEAEALLRAYDELVTLQYNLSYIVSEDNPFHPSNYNGEFSEEDMRAMYDLVVPQVQIVENPEVDGLVGFEAPVIDELQSEGIDEWNEKAIAIAEDLNDGKKVDSDDYAMDLDKLLPSELRIISNRDPGDETSG